MNSKFTTFIQGYAIGAVFAGFIALIGCVAVLNKNTKTFQTQAVKHGAAEWHVDEAGGTTFVWREE